MRRKFGVVILFCSLVITFSAGLSAQITSTTLYGQVQDATGAPLASAQVSATNTDTNLSRTVETNAEGEYRIELLPVGSYQWRSPHLASKKPF